MKTFHSFSFANYHDPRYESFGPLRVINEDRVDPGEGFGSHSHAEFGIFSYIVTGELEHRDSMGNVEIMRRGDLQMTEAGELPLFLSSLHSQLKLELFKVPAFAIRNTTATDPSPSISFRSGLCPTSVASSPPTTPATPPTNKSETVSFASLVPSRPRASSRRGRRPALLPCVTLHCPCPVSLLMPPSFHSDPRRPAPICHAPRSWRVRLAHLPARSHGHRTSQGLRPRRAFSYDSLQRSIPRGAHVIHAALSGHDFRLQHQGRSCRGRSRPPERRARAR